MSRDLKLGALLLLFLIAAGKGAAAPRRTKPYPGATPGAPGSAREKWDPLSLKPRVAALIAAGNAAAMRAFAKLLRADGWAEEAAELEAAASAAEAKKRGTR